MSIRFNGNVANYLSRTTSLPDYNSTYTIMCWLKIVVDTDATATLFNLATSSALNFDRCKLDSNGTLLGVSARNPSTVVADDSMDLTVGQWRHVTMRRASVTDLKLFLDSIEDAFSNFDATGRTVNDNLEIGRAHVNGLTIEPVNAETAYLRIWTTDLAPEEIATERVATVARKISGLYGDYPMASAATAGDDVSGNANHFTVNGTIPTGESQPSLVTGPALFRGRNFVFFDDEEVNRFEFWPAVTESGAVHERAAAINASASVEMSGQFFSIFERSIATSGAGSIVATAVFFSVLEGTTASNAIGSIETAGEAEPGEGATHERAVSLDATGSAESFGRFFSVFEASVTVSATAGIESTGEIDYYRLVAINASAGISVTGERVLDRFASLDATGLIGSNAGFFSIIERGSVVDAVTLIATGKQVGLQRSITITGVADIASSGLQVGPELERAVSVNGTSDIVTSGVRVLGRGLVVVASANISTTAILLLERSTELNTTASIAVTMQRELLRLAVLEATALISVAFSPLVVIGTPLVFLSQVAPENNLAVVAPDRHKSTA